ncbi:MAG: Gfo/Idh/MocA family oxidoreductase [Patescibacteria group bacterium]
MLKKVGFAIIGVGNIGPVHAAAINQSSNAELVAVSDVILERARKLAATYPGVKAYSNYRKMLKDPAVQAVCLCVPSGLRQNIAITCLKAGKHVLAEKPLEVTTARIDRMITAADASDVLLGCIFQTRYTKAVQLVWQALQEGRFGQLILGNAYIKWYRPEEYYTGAAWRGTKNLDGGGAAMNQGIHYIDLLGMIMGQVKQVWAQSQCAVHQKLRELGTEDLITAQLKFANGAFGTIEASTALWPGGTARLEIYGSSGRAVIEDGKLVTWNFQKKQLVDAEVEKLMEEKESETGAAGSDPMASLKTKGHQLQIEDFAAAIIDNRVPLIDGREGRPAVELIEAMYKSASTGRIVRL